MKKLIALWRYLLSREDTGMAILFWVMAGGMAILFYIVAQY